MAAVAEGMDSVFPKTARPGDYFMFLPLKLLSCPFFYPIYNSICMTVCVVSNITSSCSAEKHQSVRVSSI